MSEKIIEDKLTEDSGSVTFTFGGVLEGVRQTLSVALSVFIYGLVLGVLAGQAGLSPLEVFLMSALVFAGSSQFAALGLWVAPLPILTIILTTLVVNLRHLLMGAAVRPWIGGLKSWQAYTSLFFLSDESWALTMGQFARGKRNGAFLMGSGLALFVAWTSAGVVGRTLGSAVQDPAKWGLDFAFTAVFLFLLTGMWKGKRSLLPWIVAAAVAVAAAYAFPGTKWYIILGALAGSVVGAWGDDG
jgi:4-azaleucine resistance transporter AzlC